MVLSYHHRMNPQEAVDYAATLLRQGHIAIEEAERRLPLPTGDATVDEAVRRFVLGCKDACTGNIQWR